MQTNMADIGTPKNPFADEYLELRELQISTQIKAKEIRVKELTLQIEDTQKEITDLKKEKEKISKELKKEGTKNGQEKS